MKVVGRGRMGAVFEAYDPYIDRSVAVKVALADALQEKTSGERFRKMFLTRRIPLECCDIQIFSTSSMQE